MDRRKELKLQYKEMKPDMGIFAVKSKVNNKYFIETTQNLKAGINKVKFQLKFGNHPSEELQREWEEYSENNFTFEILEKLEYDEDESKNDYSKDLTILQMIWEEKLLKQNIEFFS